jgi:DNA polymerase-3 subunit epsilon
MDREIVLDTETTGLDARKGDRLIEIGCIELVDKRPTGREFHKFLNPERVVHPDAIRIHGLTNEFLADKPLFADVADDFLAFIGSSTLVIHNAPFDIGFLNVEFERLGKPALSMDRVVDTLALARRKNPAGPNTLDALCKRFDIDNSKRTKHGALVDSLLLAEVYVELLGARQTAMDLTAAPARSVQDRSVVHPGTSVRDVSNRGGANGAPMRPDALPPRVTSEDLARHAEFVATLGANPLWIRLRSET